MQASPAYRFVGQTAITRLYHYERFKAEHLSSLLRDQKICCSNPANLNDPWDFRPAFNSQSLEDPVKLEEALVWYHAQGDGSLSQRQIDLFNDSLRSDRNARIDFIEGLTKQNIALIDKRRMYCMTPLPTCTLMWSHYAGNHRGICLEFGIDNPLFAKALSVIYQPKYPVWSPMDFEAQQTRAMEMLLTKAVEWGYEREYRIITLHNNELDTPLHVDEKGRLPLPPGSLKSVIAGCQADYDAVNAIVKAHMPDLPVRRAVRVADHFKLTIEG
jgi:hypothetical protein